MASFFKAIPTVFKHEGGLSFHKSDPGGTTKYGISLRFLRKEGLDVDGDGDSDVDDIMHLTKPLARRIYQHFFWLTRYNDIKSQAIATKIFDTAVNMGHSRAHKILQKSLNILGENLVVDGKFGPKTLASLNRFSGEDLLQTFRQKQAERYNYLMSRNSKLKAFKRGWMRRAYS